MKQIMKDIKPQAMTLIELWTKSNLINRKLDATLGSIHGIGFTEYMVLFHLVEAPNQVLRRIDLAYLLGRSASGITKMLSPMEKIGLVAKEINPRDARVSLVKTTATGNKIFQQASQTINQTAAQLLSRIDSTNITDLLKLLEAIGD